MDRTVFDKRIDSLLEQVEQLIPGERPPDLIGMEYAPDVRGWHDFELDLWKTGEEIRQVLTDAKKALNPQQAERVCRICADQKAMRGRQSFVLLLGRKRHAVLAERLADLLGDEEIDGQLIHSLYLMGASQYVPRVSPFLTCPKTWIRNEAKRYVAKYETSILA